MARTGRTRTSEGSELRQLDLVIRGDAPGEALVSYARQKMLAALRTASGQVRSGRLTLRD